jgi:hypothetical protein
VDNSTEIPVKKRSRISLSEAGAVDEAIVKKRFQNEWGLIEQAYGRTLTDPVRNSIISAVYELWNDTIMEQNAPPLKDIYNRLNNLRQGALVFKSLLNSRALLDRDQRAVAILVRHEIKDLGQPRADLRTSALMASRLVTACGRALRKLGSERGFTEGDAWRAFIRTLRTTLKKAGLPTGATQSRDKSSHDAVSPFVALVTALQKRFPENIRRHDRADPLSLAKEINRARQPVRAKQATFSGATISRSKMAGHHAALR